MSDLPKSVHIFEQGPREGFQFEKGVIPTARKIELVDALSGTGLKQIQVCSFVPAKNVPGMADADEVAAGFKRRPGVRYEALSLNEKGGPVDDPLGPASFVAVVSRRTTREPARRRPLPPHADRRAYQFTRFSLNPPRNALSRTRTWRDDFS